MGLVLLPSYSLENDIRSGRLIRLLPDHLFGSVTIFMAYPSRRLLSQKSEVLLISSLKNFRTLA
jgi:DNA-binding transcriptional LysR family regulator